MLRASRCIFFINLSKVSRMHALRKNSYGENDGSMEEKLNVLGLRTSGSTGVE